MALIVLFGALIILVVLYFLLQGVQSARSWMRKHSSASEQCPACEQYIVAGEVPESCSECGVKLARNIKGELMIRVN